MPNKSVVMAYGDQTPPRDADSQCEVYLGGARIIRALVMLAPPINSHHPTFEMGNPFS